MHSPRCKCYPTAEWRKVEKMCNCDPTHCSQTQPLMLTRQKVGDAPFVNMQPTNGNQLPTNLLSDGLYDGRINVHWQHSAPSLMSFLIGSWGKKICPIFWTRKFQYKVILRPKYLLQKFRNVKDIRELWNMLQSQKVDYGLLAWLWDSQPFHRPELARRRVQCAPMHALGEWTEHHFYLYLYLFC